MDEVGRLPASGDNGAVALFDLPAGARIRHTGGEIVLRHGIPEGHRFTVAPVGRGEKLVSWGLPYGRAGRDIQAGEYLCNRGVLEHLRLRGWGGALPEAPNFEDFRERFNLARWEGPLPQVWDLAGGLGGSFSGYFREGGRGVGTRNYVVVLGTSAMAGGAVRDLARRFRGAAGGEDELDGVVAVAHTEGGGERRPNNFELVLRTLAGWMVHPNVGAVLAMDAGGEAVNNEVLNEYLLRHAYPVDAIPHAFLSLRDAGEAAMRRGEKLLDGFVESCRGARRSRQSPEALKVALQCGGSDAFSGISGNPLAGALAREVVRNRGTANLAETSELIGAEPYILQKIRDEATGRAFLEKLSSFQEWAGWHGHSAAGNPSGGNLYRGLYNITIKSIGAARKKDPAVRLDYVIDYAERQTAPGFYFMDSPGNDLESIAGQVASGCNLILFVTGSGSITNFPFVPTLKIVTTSGRYRLLSEEMDLNAGRYLDGLSMARLVEGSWPVVLNAASGARTAGESAGHSQAQIWRDWHCRGRGTSPEKPAASRAAGRPLPLVDDRRAGMPFPGDGLQGALNRARRRRLGLILPASLCASEVAVQLAAAMNEEEGADSAVGIDGFVVLPHTEGCGVSRGASERLFLQTLCGYVRHPAVTRCLILEHGCEKTHNDEIRRFLREAGFDADTLGWASIQADGGMAKTALKVKEWFFRPAAPGIAAEKSVPLSMGCLVRAEPQGESLEGLEAIFRSLLKAGGSVVIPHFHAARLGALLSRMVVGEAAARGTLDFGAEIRRPGLHLMDCPGDQPIEAITGLGAAGVDVVLILTDNPDRSHPGHPMIPVLTANVISQDPAGDVSLAFPETGLRCLLGAVAGEMIFSSRRFGGHDFQIPRGATGVSL